MAARRNSDPASAASLSCVAVSIPNGAESELSSGAITVERLRSRASFEEFARLPFQIYSSRDAWWPPDVGSEVDLLAGRSYLSANLSIEPFCARRGSRMVARVSALVNRRYIEHWGEQLGHLVHFEALEDEDEAAAQMIDAAVASLRDRGMRAVRAGFAAFLDYPYAIDSYGALPSFLLRGSSHWYHRYFKNAGFQTEKGQLDYTAHLTPDLLARYRGILEGAHASAVVVQSWREFGYLAAIDSWTDVTNTAFDRHWGWHPISHAEVRPMLTSLWETPVADLSMIGSVGGGPVGAVFSVHDLSPSLAIVKRGTCIPPERGGGTRGALINVGVKPAARGRGIALAMAARSYLEMAERGMQYAGYTLVLDDNWPSRRTAEKLGAHVTGNFVNYRLNL